MSSKALEVQIKSKVVLNLRIKVKERKREHKKKAEAIGEKQWTKNQKNREAEMKESRGIKI